MCPNGSSPVHLINPTDAGVKFGDVVSSMESDPGFLSGPRRYVRGAEKSSLEYDLHRANLQWSDAPAPSPENSTRWIGNPGPLFAYAGCLESKSGSVGAVSMNGTVGRFCAKMHLSCSPASPLLYPLNPEYKLRGVVSSMESDNGSLMDRHMSEREVEEHKNFICCDVLLMELHALVDHFEMCYVFVTDPNQPRTQLRPQPPFPSPVNLKANFTTPNGNGSSSGFDFYAIDMWPQGTTSFAPSTPSSWNSIPISLTCSSTLGGAAGALPLMQPLKLTSTDGIEMNGIRSSVGNPSGALLLTAPVTPFANVPSGLVNTDFTWTARSSGELAAPMVYAQNQSQGQGQLYLAGPRPFDTGHLLAKHNNRKVFSYPYASASSTPHRAYEHPVLSSASSSSGASTSAAISPPSGYPPNPDYEYYVRGFPGTGNTARSSADLGGQEGMDAVGLTESAAQQGKTFSDFPYKEDFLQAEEGVLQKVVDIVQFAIKLGETNGIRSLDRFLTRTAEKRGILPSAIFLTGVCRIGHNYAFGGGFADVWKGLYEGRDVALKVLRISSRADREKMQIDISKEALLWRRLDHPNILPFIGICRDVFGPQMALVSPWMEKGSLTQYLEENPQADCLKLAIGVAHGVAYLHSLNPQVIHGDLRTANVLIDGNDEPRITDFGLSRAIDSQGTLFSASFQAGTLRWQAPELIRVDRFGEGTGRLTAKSDDYAFSCLCFEIFTGKAPFHGLRDAQVIQLVVTMNRRPPWPGNAAVSRGLSNDIWSIMQSCWRNQPSDRPDMSFVVSQLQEIDFRRNSSRRWTTYTPRTLV